MLSLLWHPSRGPARSLAGLAARYFATASAERSSRFNSLNQDDVGFFRGLLGHGGVITEPGSLEPFNRSGRSPAPPHQPGLHGTPPHCRPRMTCRDWMGKYQGASKLALRPKETQQVSEILAYCSLRKLAVVPQVGSAPRPHPPSAARTGRGG
jgi:D-2-hydroxyglutarate dehydrogenase